MKPTAMKTPMIFLCFGLTTVPAAADNGGIYMRLDTDASVELSNMPADANYELVIASPSPPPVASPPLSANAAVPTASAVPAIPAAPTAGVPAAAEHAPIADAEPASPPASPPAAERKAADAPPQTTTRGYLESLLRMRGRDPASIHGIDKQPANN